MTGLFKKTVLATALAASALASSTPALADPGRGHRGGDGAGPAIALGIFGLALGAIIASSGNRHHDADDGYYSRNPREGWVWRDGCYWDRQGHRYDRDGRPTDRDGDDGYYRRGYGDPRGGDPRGGYQGGGYQGGGYQGGQNYGGQPYNGGYRGY